MRTLLKAPKTRLGLAARLYVAIGGAVALTLIASIVAWLSFIDQSDHQSAITNRYLPAITISLRLSRQSALIASTVPRLLVATDEEERLGTIADLEELQAGFVRQLEELEETMGSGAIDRSDYSPLATLWGENHRLSQTLAELGEAIGVLHEEEEEMAAQVARAAALQRELIDLIGPLVDEMTFYMVTGYRSLDDTAPAPLEDRVDPASLAAFAALTELQAEANLAIGLLTEGSVTPDAALLRPLRERFDASLNRFATAMTNFGDAPDAAAIEAAFEEMIELGQDDDNIIDLRNLIIQQMAEAERLANTSRRVAASMSTGVGRIVQGAQNGTLTAIAATEAEAEFSSRLLLWVNVIAVIGAIIIGWIYVRRSFTEPVLRLTAAAARFENDEFDEAALAPTARRRDELGNLARTFTKMAHEVHARTEILDRMVAERTQQLNEKNQALQRTLNQIADELTIAQRTQLSILPSHVPSIEGLRLFAHMHAAREVGGDFYDLIELDTHRVGIVVADVSDKGVPAALMMAVSYTLIKSTAMHEPSPAKVLAEVNRVLSEDNDTMMFVTAFYGVVDVRTGRFTFANAGHDAPLLKHLGAPAEALPLLGGVALGVLEDATYDETSVDLQSGDTVVLYTDGVTEAFDDTGTPFTVDGLKALLDEAGPLPAEEMCNRVLDGVEKHAKGTPQSDDITCVVLKFGSAFGDGQAAVNDDAAKVPELVVPLKADLDEITRLAEAVDRFAAENGLDKAFASQLNLILDEVVGNAINYGCVEDRDYHLQVRLRLLESRLELVLEDDGKPFNPLEVPPPDVEASLDERKIGGLGLHLVRHFADDLAYEHDGRVNRLTIVKSVERQD